jgi:hypothetical protein
MDCDDVFIKMRIKTVSAQYPGGGPTRQLTIPSVVILDGWTAQWCDEPHMYATKCRPREAARPGGPNAAGAARGWAPRA